MSVIMTVLKSLSLQTQGTPQLSGDDKGSFILRFAEKRLNLSTEVKMLGFPLKKNYHRVHLHVHIKKLFFKTCIACFLGIPEALSSWFVDHWNGIVDLETQAGPPFMWNCGIFKVSQDILALLSAFTGFINMKFVQFSPATLEILNKCYLSLLVMLLYAYFIIFQHYIF